MRATIQRLLGPRMSFRRKALLTLIPGLGQVAVGRDFRAFMFFLPLLFVLASWMGYIYAFFFDIAALPGKYDLNSIIFPVLGVGMGVWAAMAVDALRLDHLTLNSPEPIPIKRKIVLFILPVFTAFAAGSIQLIQDALIKNFFGAEKWAQASLAGPLALGVALPVNQAAYTTMIFFYLIAWAVATGSIFGCTGWMLGGRKRDIFALGFCGIFLGPFLWVSAGIFSQGYSPSISEGVLVIFTVFGGVVAGFLWVIVGPSRVSWLIIPAGASAAWVGELLGRMVGLGGLPEVFLPTALIMVTTFSIHIAIILVTVGLPSRQSVSGQSMLGHRFWARPLAVMGAVVLICLVVVGLSLQLVSQMVSPISN